MNNSDLGIEDLLRTIAPQVLGVITRKYRDFDTAEDAVQEAMIIALERWPRDGIPAEPVPWMITTASRRLIDRWRSDLARRDREQLHGQTEPGSGEVAEADDTLTLLFLCCHPALTPASAIALTLRAVGGLTTEEIARAFLVPSATMGQRISRAKSKIKKAGATFTLPAPEDRPARLGSVLRVLYLIFNEGYAATAGTDLRRDDLCDEAIRLARLLQRLVPDDGEVGGLLALMLLIDARRDARTDANGVPVQLPDQDRARWDAGRIEEGVRILDAAIGRGRVGEYQLQAAIAAVHDRARTAAETDWPQILGLYGLLERITGSPIVALNRAVAVAMVDGPEAGLAVVAGVADALAGQQRLHAVRGHLLERAGRIDEALADYRTAAALATSEPERRQLVLQAARLRDQLTR